MGSRYVGALTIATVEKEGEVAAVVKPGAAAVEMAAAQATANKAAGSSPATAPVERKRDEIRLAENDEVNGN